jgi:hypothetical protein
MTTPPQKPIPGLTPLPESLARVRHPPLPDETEPGNDRSATSSLWCNLISLALVAVGTFFLFIQPGVPGVEIPYGVAAGVGGRGVANLHRHREVNIGSAEARYRLFIAPDKTRRIYQFKPGDLRRLDEDTVERQLREAHFESKAPGPDPSTLSL